jgi:kynurenine formamidase
MTSTTPRERAARRRTLVDHRVPDAASGVAALVIRLDERASKSFAELSKGAFVTHRPALLALRAPAYRSVGVLRARLRRSNPIRAGRVWWTLTFTAEEPAARIAAVDVSAAAVYRAPPDTSTDAGGPIMTILRYRIVRLALVTACALAALTASAAAAGAASQLRGQSSHAQGHSLWKVYDHVLREAKYIDLTHTITPSIPVWAGFGPSTFMPASDPTTGEPYTYAESGFEATAYMLQTDQLGTQLDPPAHWAPEYPAIDELPPTFAVRPLVVISIVPQVERDFNYALQVSDIRRWEERYGRIPEGSVVMVRSDWSTRWPDPALATLTEFPGVSLEALQFLHLQRHILFHGHEPLDTDSTPTLEGEAWLMHHGFAQAEGVANLDKVPATGCLLEMGYPKFGGGLGGYARFIAICPRTWEEGVSVGEVPEAPLQRYDNLLHWDSTLGMRVR